jgi:hypothetical protein
MLAQCKMILEKDGENIAINSDRFDKLVTLLRTAVDNDGMLEGAYSKSPPYNLNNLYTFRIGLSLPKSCYLPQSYLIVFVRISLV